VQALKKSNEELNQKYVKLKTKFEKLTKLVRQFYKEATKILDDTPLKNKKRKLNSEIEIGTELSS
jgi:hypothetical protein